MSVVELTDLVPSVEMVETQQNTQAEVVKGNVQRDARGRIVSGTPNPGGRPKKLRDIEKMLNTEHRNLPRMREVFERLRSLAMGEVILVPVITAQGEVQMTCKLDADARFMQLYLDRLLGPAKAFDDGMDLSDAPSEVIEYLRIKVSR